MRRGRGEAKANKQNSIGAFVLAPRGIGDGMKEDKEEVVEDGEKNRADNINR